MASDKSIHQLRFDAAVKVIENVPRDGKCVHHAPHILTSCNIRVNSAYLSPETHSF